MSKIDFGVLHAFKALQVLHIEYPPKKCIQASSSLNSSNEFVRIMDVRQVCAESMDLSVFPSLSALRISELSGEKLSFLRQTKSLAALDVGGLKINSLSGLEYVSKTLKILCISQTVSKELQDFEVLDHMHSMEKLVLSSCPSMTKVPSYGNCKKLRYLVVEKCSKFESLDGLESVPKLEFVCVKSKNITSLSWVLNPPLKFLIIDGNSGLADKYREYKFPDTVLYVRINGEVLRGDVSILRRFMDDENESPWKG